MLAPLDSLIPSDLNSGLVKLKPDTTVLAERISRLERTVVSLAAIVSGEATAKGSEEEIAAVINLLAIDLKAMATDLWNERDGDGVAS